MVHPTPGLTPWKPPRLYGRRGQSLVIVLVILPLLVGAAALGVSVATWYNAQAWLQNAVDAAAIAGAQAVVQGDANAPSDQASWVTRNDPSAQDVSVVLLPNTPFTVQAQATVKVSGTFAALFGERTVPVTATARASYGPSGPFAYAVFQAASGVDDTPLTFNGGDHVAPYGNTLTAANVHSNDGLLLNGNVTIQGACTAASAITDNGNATCTQGLVPHSSILPLPTWTTQALTQQATSTYGSPSDPTELTVNGATTVSGNWLVYGSVTLNGGITGPGSITAIGGSITLNGSDVTSGSNGLGVCLAAIPTTSDPTPGVTLNGSVQVTGIVYAPAGSVTFNGNDTVQGAVVGQYVVLNGSVAVEDDPQQAFTVPIHQVALVP